jgi:hypothetical protein
MVDEFDYLRKTGAIGVSRINDDRRRGDGNPLERCKRLLERIQIQDLGVRRSTRLGGRSAACDSRPCDSNVDRAVDDAELREVGESGSRPARHNRSWKAASATRLTPAVTITRSTSKNVSKARTVSGSPAAGRKYAASA